jgi:phosphoribosylformimino-5-aminoimidazole carboxamide ribotide isomerase
MLSGCNGTVSYIGTVVWLVQDDLELVRDAGRGNVNVTVGSALDIFGGDMPYTDVLRWHRQQQQQAAAL